MESNQAGQTPQNKRQWEVTQANIVSDTQSESEEKTRMRSISSLKQPQGSNGAGEALADCPPFPAEHERDKRQASSEDHFTLPGVLPILPLQETVVYPFIVRPLAVKQERDIRLIEDVMRGDGLVVLVAQESADREQAEPGYIFIIGTVARVTLMLLMPDGTLQLIVQGLARVVIGEYTQEQPYLAAHVAFDPENQTTDDENEALKRSVISSYQRFVELAQSVPSGVNMASLMLEEPLQVAYAIATSLQTDLERRQQLLELDSVQAKLVLLSTYLTYELEMLEFGKKIRTRARPELSKTQQKYLPHDQHRAIRHEPGEESEEQATITELRRKIDAASMPDEALKEAQRELSRLEKLPAISPEYSIIHTYLELVTSLPWSRSTGEQINVPRASEVLDQDHYNVEKIKDRILEHLAVRRLREERMLKEHNQLNRGPILCFVGPPGVGKTSLGQSIARALGRKFAHMALGGIRDEAEIRGHRRTYLGAMPGRIIETLRRVETNDPVIMLDEVDKVGTDWRGDPSSALLEVLDPEQNSSFRDNYLDLAFDLSRVMFITTANALEPILPALRDRMEILELSGYTEEQKLHIARTYLLPKQLAASGLKPGELLVDEETLRRIARDYTREAGVRTLERAIGSLCRKFARQVVEGQQASLHVTVEDLPAYLGRQRFSAEAAERIDRPGIATGLVWTPVGGEIIFIEAAAMPAQETHLTLTGQLGEVMKESAMAALSYVCSNAQALGLPEQVFEKQHVHIHVPAGAIPKDGPSAGVTMVTVIVSLARGRKVRSDVAMTGEITLRGRVLPVGGVKEKVLAAYRSGIHTVILPQKNEQELLEDVPNELRAQMTFVYVNDITQVLAAALEPEPDKIEQENAGTNHGAFSPWRGSNTFAAQAH